MFTDPEYLEQQLKVTKRKNYFIVKKSSKRKKK